MSAKGSELPILLKEQKKLINTVILCMHSGVKIQAAVAFSDLSKGRHPTSFVT